MNEHHMRVASTLCLTVQTYHIRTHTSAYQFLPAGARGTYSVLTHFGCTRVYCLYKQCPVLHAFLHVSFLCTHHFTLQHLLTHTHTHTHTHTYTHARARIHM